MVSTTSNHLPTSMPMGTRIFREQFASGTGYPSQQWVLHQLRCSRRQLYQPYGRCGRLQPSRAFKHHVSPAPAQPVYTHLIWHNFMLLRVIKKILRRHHLHNFTSASIGTPKFTSSSWRGFICFRTLRYSLHWKKVTGTTTPSIAKMAAIRRNQLKTEDWRPFRCSKK